MGLLIVICYGAKEGTLVLKQLMYLTNSHNSSETAAQLSADTVIQNNGAIDTSVTPCFS